MTNGEATPSGKTTGLRISVPDQEWAQRLADLPDCETVIWDEIAAQPSDFLDLVLRDYRTDVSVLANYQPDRIGLIQSQLLGFDRVDEFLPAGATYANVRGVHEGSTAELAMALLLASVRGVDQFARAQETQQWTSRFTAGLQGRRVVLMGVGGIGSELNARLQGFECDIVRVGSTARTDELGPVHGVDELSEILPSVDAVIVAVPLTPTTTGLIDETFLAALPDGALVINVSRGKVADTDAVVADRGRIHYASDVFDPEPLLEGHPLWSRPNTLITPHVGGMTSSMRDRVESVVREQVDRIRSGQPPLHVVLET